MWGEDLFEIERRRLSLRIGVGRQDDLQNPPLFQPLGKPLDPDVVGPNAVQRGEGAMQDMVEPPVFPRSFHHQEVHRFLDNANEALITFRIVANTAEVPLRQVLASLAEADLFPHEGEGADQILDKPLGIPNEKQRESHRRFFADPREPAQGRGETVDRIFCVHEGPLFTNPAIFWL